MLPTGKGRGRHRDIPARARATRRRGARSSRTGSACPSRTSRCSTATPRSPQGLDTYGSRSLVVGAEAVIRAADKVIEKARVVAAHLLEASVEDIDFANGSFTVRGTDIAKAMAEVVWAAFSAHNLPDGFEPNLDSRRPSTR